MIPFSVALEDRLSKMSEVESAEELKKLGTKSALPRIAVSGMDPQNLLSLSPFPCLSVPACLFLSLVSYSLLPDTVSVGLSLSTLGGG